MTEDKLKHGPLFCNQDQALRDAIESGDKEAALKAAEQVYTQARRLQAYGRFWMQQATKDKSITFNPKYLNW